MLRNRYIAALLMAGALLCLSQTAVAGKHDHNTTYPGKTSVFSVVDNGDGTYGITLDDPDGDFDFTTLASLTVADVNNDGFPDLLIGLTKAGGGGVQALLNDGQGSGIVVYKTTLATGATKHNRAATGVAVTDVNGDGWPDIITGNGSDGTVSVLLNDETGSFVAPQLYAAGADVSEMTTGDLNGDGIADIVTVDSATGIVAVLLSDGHGNYGTAATYATGATGEFTTTGSIFEVNELEIGDTNGDGLPDISFASEGKLLNNGDGTFTVKSTPGSSNGCASCGLSGGSGGDISIGGVDLSAGTGGLSTDPGSMSGSGITTGSGSVSLPTMSSPGKITVVVKGSSTSTASSKSMASPASGGGTLDWLVLSLLGVATWSRPSRSAVRS